MENEFKTVTNAKGLEIPKYSKDFKKLVEKDRQLAEYLCMNYEDLDSEDLGAFLNGGAGVQLDSGSYRK